MHTDPYGYGLTVGILFVEHLTGIAVGIILGFIGCVFSYLPNSNLTSHIKMWYVVICATAIGIASEKIEFFGSKFLASLTLGFIL